jgi:hypothetical protein
MMREIFIGSSNLNTEKYPIKGEFTEIDGESYYKISNYDLMDPFFMTIVCSSDHWMFISSNGALTAGRKDPDNTLFPYYTADKIEDTSEITGNKTILLLNRGGRIFLWEPFSERYSGIYRTKRNIYKCTFGNKIIFEEINEDLGMTFSYKWMNSEKYGFIKKSTISNSLETECSVSVLDGIQNILPSGINRTLQLLYSNLVDAYKKSELIEGNNIALFMLSSILTDKAEPSEALKTTIAWHAGLENPRILLSSIQINKFRDGSSVETETDIRASRGAYIINTDLNFRSGEHKSWYIISDINKDAGYICSLKNILKRTVNLEQQLESDVSCCTDGLAKILAAADGFQLTRDKLSINRHLSNALFNVMRGGIFDDNYSIQKNDFLEFVQSSNRSVFLKNSDFLESLTSSFSFLLLLEKVYPIKDIQLKRLCFEYLPLILSRRHGDPSRPWNLFSIELKRDNGSKNYYYQGNWRDIFQNWEALCLSYPSFSESFICKFLSASTADGYNPYRITRDGIDWESTDPHNPWAGIGYWGDHQIIYLLKLLEISKRYHPSALIGMLSEKIFAFADVPYRIKSFNDILKNPFETIDFDVKAEETIIKRTEIEGSDGKLIHDKNGEILLTNLAEKLLIASLAKLSNFIPEAGIWMNTQRPEWNDANNALVGNGASMVTLYYLRRYLDFCKAIFNESPSEQYNVSQELAVFFKSVYTIFLKYEYLIKNNFTDKDRKSILDELGLAGSNYRNKIYKHGFSGKIKSIKASDLSGFFSITIKFIDHSIRKNRHQDNLFHSYNLIKTSNDSVSMRHLYEMLEGQVAVLSSGLLSPEEVNHVLDALKWSSMFRRDQYSYMLYPDRQLPKFIEKNIIPEKDVKNCELLSQLISENNTEIIYHDEDGIYHFCSNFRNASDLSKALDQLDKHRYGVSKEKESILGIFEKVFDHQSFTGRSGTFYGYEGLGCIYWHMVSKLLLAINENYFSAMRNGADKIQLGKMVNHYYDVRAGIGLNKSPEIFGAFPTDAYSHSPGTGGARQPGMTGQVKEDIISRFGELGVIVENGCISFNPCLLRKSEFLVKPDSFRYITIQNSYVTIELEPNTLAFTLCQVPVVYHISQQKKITITTADSALELAGLTLDTKMSCEIFNRTGRIVKLDVYLLPSLD